MTRREFRIIRLELGLSQSQLAIVMGWRNALTVSNYERQRNPRRIPFHVQMLMEALAFGYRPETWHDVEPRKRAIR